MNRIKKINYVYLITVLVIMVSSTGIIPFNKFVNSYAGLLILSQVIIVLPSILYLVMNRINYKEAVRFKKISGGNVIRLVVFTYLVIPVMTFVNALSQLYAVDTTSDTMNSVTTNSPFLISLFVIALIPCVFEETVYRGIFFNEYAKHNKIGAIVLSAFLFGILHGNLNQFTYAFFMGIIFAFMIEATDSIVSTMIIHFIINGNSVVLLYLYPKLFAYLETLYQSAIERGDSSTVGLIEQLMGGNNFNINEIMDGASAAISNSTFSSVIADYGLFALLCGGLAFLVFWRIAVKANRWEQVKEIFHKDYHADKNRLFSKKTFSDFIPLYIAMSLCIIGMILNELLVRGIIE